MKKQRQRKRRGRDMKGYERIKMAGKRKCVELNSNFNALTAVDHAHRISVVSIW